MIARSGIPTAARRALGGLLAVLLAAVGLINGPGRGSAAPIRPAAAAKGMPVTGTCFDDEGQPLAGVKVTLYREDYKAKKHEKLKTLETGADGRFEFADAPALEDDRGLALVVTKAGRGSIIQPLFAELLEKPLELRVRPADTLKGRVTDEAGKPVAAARVWANALRTGPIDGIRTAVTDADGKYAITDMGRWTDEDNRPRPIGNGRAVVQGPVFFDVRHPDFAHERPTWNRIPSTVDVVLHPGGVIEGKVIDRVTGKPAAAVTVSAWGIKESPSFEQVRTDAEGKYQIRCLKAGQYNLWAEAPERACVAIDSLTVAAGKTLAGQDMTLIEGGWIEGRVVDATTGAPIAGTKDQPLRVACFGPGRPKSAGYYHVARVDENGEFRLRVAPGRNYPYIMTSEMWSRTEGKAHFEAGIEVKAGEATKVSFRVTPGKPR
jgi:5-hydroxyisourate hydrolase-like protein (transthyretin family)